MTRIAVAPSTLVVDIEGLDQVWSFRRGFTIPLWHVRSATVDPFIARERTLAIRAPGLYIPGLIKAGTYIQNGERSFWMVRKPADVLVIELIDEPYARLVLSVDDPRSVVQAILRAQRDQRAA